MLQNEKLEQAILACMLIDRDCSADAGLLSSDDFVAPVNKKTFNSIRRLGQADKQVDYMTVYQAMNQEVSLTTLMALAESMPTVINFEQYIEELKDLTLKRKLYKLSDEMKNKNKTGKEIAEVAEKEIFNIQESMSTGEIEGAKDLVLPVVDHMQQVYNGEIKPGLMSGYRALDNLVDGYKKSDLIILAARPGMGKTSLAMNIAENIVYEDGTVAFFSLEMSKQELMQRLVLSSALVSNNKMRGKAMSGTDWEKISKATSAILQTKLFIDDDPSRTVPEMKSISRRIKRREGLDLVIVDYLQLMTGESGKGNREQEISAISRGLKILAKELDVPVMALSQLSRAPEMREDKRPILSDLRESGSIEQDADVVKFIYRDDYYDSESEEPGVAEILVRKNRKGPMGICRLGWLSDCTRFIDLQQLETRR